MKEKQIDVLPTAKAGGAFRRFSVKKICRGAKS